VIYVDGAQKSGSGIIVRFAVGLATLLGEELHLTNIRAKTEVNKNLVKIQGIGYSLGSSTIN